MVFLQKNTQTSFYLERLRGFTIFFMVVVVVVVVVVLLLLDRLGPLGQIDENVKLHCNGANSVKILDMNK